VREGSDFVDPLSYRVELVSPPEMNFDLYVYKGTHLDSDCSAQGVKGTGNPEQVSDSWGDTIGDDDGYWYIIEVRYVSGTVCGDDATWTLSITGNTVL
jgi:hypothetical protein